MPTTIEASSLKDLSAACQRLGADVRYRPEAHYFTALACNEWGGVCFRGSHRTPTGNSKKGSFISGNQMLLFDPFSTLVYQI